MKICLREEHIKSLRNACACFLLTFLCSLIIKNFYSITMISPDDIRFQNILSGTFTGIPDAHCYFIQYPMATCIAWLYKLEIRVDWYENILIFLVFLCLYCILRRGKYLSLRNNIIYLFGVIIIWGTTFVRCSVALEWTVIAGLLAATTIFLYMTMPVTLNGEWKNFLACICLLGVGFCLRKSVIWMYIPLAGMCWLQRMSDFKLLYKSDKTYFKNSCFLIICITMILLIMTVHFYAYHEEGWQMYNDYTKNRSTLVDYNGYPDYYENEEIYSKAGVTQEAYNLMCKDYNYMIAFNRNMNLKYIADLSETIDGKTMYQKVLKALEMMKKTYFRHELLGYNIMVFLLLFANLCMISFMNKNKRLGIIGTVLWMFAFSFILALEGRFPYRVAMTIEMGGLAVMAGTLFQVFADTTVKSKRSRWLIVCLYSVIVGQMCWNLLVLYSDVIEYNEMAQARKEIDEYCHSHCENIYIQDWNSFSQYAQYIYTSNYGMESNIFLSGGWSYNSPIYFAQLKKDGYSNIYDMIYDKKNVYYMVNDKRDDGVIQRLDEYFDSEGLEIYMKKDDAFYCQTGKVMIYRFEVEEF